MMLFGSDITRYDLIGNVLHTSSMVSKKRVHQFYS